MSPRPGTRRVVTTGGWVIVQVAQADGTWWNLRAERANSRTGQALAATA